MSAPVDLQALEAHAKKMQVVHAVLGGGAENDTMLVLIAALREARAALDKVRAHRGFHSSSTGEALYAATEDATDALARIDALVKVT